MKDEKLKAKCLANDETCKTCFGLGCNHKANFAQCLVTKKDQIFPWNLYETISPQICSKYNDNCFIQVIGGDTVIRGCVEEFAAQSDLSPDFFTNVENHQTYRVCSEPLCNNEDLRAKSCISCNSTADRRCVFDSIYLQKNCFPLELDHSGCYHYVDGDYVEKGCITHLKGSRRVECESEGEERCKKCDGFVCNGKSRFMACIQSDKDDVNVPRPSEPCRRYDDQCFIRVSNGVVRRGCLSDLIDSPVSGIDSDFIKKGTVFEKCQFENCNDREIEQEQGNEKIPEDRLKCYQCNGGRDCNLMHSKSQPLEATLCKVHSQYDQCYTFIDKGKGF